MINLSGVRSQRRNSRTLPLGGKRLLLLLQHIMLLIIIFLRNFWFKKNADMDFVEPKTKNNLMGKLLLLASLVILAFIVINKASSFTSPSAVSSSSHTKKNLKIYIFLMVFCDFFGFAFSFLKEKKE